MTMKLAQRQMCGQRKVDQIRHIQLLARGMVPADMTQDQGLTVAQELPAAQGVTIRRPAHDISLQRSLLQFGLQAMKSCALQ